MRATDLTWAVTTGESAIEPYDSVVRKPSDPPEDPILRAKYLDWCSARVAERFVKLTPEEIYQLAEQATRARAGVDREALHSGSPTSSASPSPTEPSPDQAEVASSFKTIVEKVTEALTAELELPPFEQWAAAYQEDPARFDEELLGLWRERL